MTMDKFATEWLIGISKKYQANMSKDGNNDCVLKELGNFTVILCVRKQGANGKPWWGVQCKLGVVAQREQREVVVNKIIGKTDVDSRNLIIDNPYYLVWSDTSFENGERRFSELIEILSE